MEHNFVKKQINKSDIIIVIVLAALTVGYFAYNNITSEKRGINSYSEALSIYKNADYETAYQVFGKVPSASTLKESALFRPQE